MEVAVPTVHDFHFSSTASSPYVSAPSSPKSSSGDPFDLYRHYTSAPTSPTRAAAIYAHFNSLSLGDSDPIPPSRSPSLPAAGVPFDWEETPGTPKSLVVCGASLDDDGSTVDELDFAFDFSGQLGNDGRPAELTTADELFEQGKIRPLKPPPRLQYPAPAWGDVSTAASSPRSPKSPRRRGLWSPRQNRGRFGREGEGFDPFTAAMVETTRDGERGRTSSAFPSISYSRSRKGSRSLSPLRVQNHHKSVPSSPKPQAAAAVSAGNGTLKTGSGSKKWRLRDLLLFRSASEGRATGNRSKDPLRKYTQLSPSTSNKKVNAEDLKNSSFRSTDSGGSFRRGSAVSPHELHYAANRAASEEMKKKTALPYRQGLFSYLRFNPAISSIAKGFSNGYTFTRGSS